MVKLHYGPNENYGNIKIIGIKYLFKKFMVSYSNIIIINYNYWVIRSKSISLASMRSTNGKASKPWRPGWIPQSS